MCLKMFRKNKMVINELLRSEILIEQPDNKFKCICGSILKRNSIYKHIDSKKHLNYVENMDKNVNINISKEECTICYIEKKEFYTCFNCKNKHCMECHNKIRNLKCPFCREIFKEEAEKLRIATDLNMEIISIFMFFSDLIEENINNDFRRLILRHLNNLINVMSRE